MALVADRQPVDLLAVEPDQPRGEALPVLLELRRDGPIFLRVEDLKKRVFLLQQAARQGMTVKKRLSDGFRMRLPVKEQG